MNTRKCFGDEVVPKILLAQNYADALEIYRKYRNNIMGIISDVSFKMTSNRKDPKVLAGIELCRLVKSEDQNIPFLLQSSDKSNEQYANQLVQVFCTSIPKTFPMI